MFLEFLEKVELGGLGLDREIGYRVSDVWGSLEVGKLG